MGGLTTSGAFESRTLCRQDLREKRTHVTDSVFQKPEQQKALEGKEATEGDEDIHGDEQQQQ